MELIMWKVPCHILLINVTLPPYFLSDGDKYTIVSSTYVAYAPALTIMVTIFLYGYFPWLYTVHIVQ